MTTLALRRGLDWGTLGPLRLRARAVASGLYAGPHKSLRRGAGIEFGGHREYLPGDDLRWLDRRSLLAHDRYVVRQFETETDRALRLVVDATASMAYRGTSAPGAKLAYVGLLAAALAYVSIGSGDPVGLGFVGGRDGRPLPPRSGKEQFERVVSALESVDADGDAKADGGLFARSLESLIRGARRGSIVMVFSDLFDMAATALDHVAALASSGRVLTVIRVLDPDERDFPFEGSVRLRAMEGTTVVETDGDAARERYLDALHADTERWRAHLATRGARLLVVGSDESPTEVVRRIVATVR